MTTSSEAPHEIVLDAAECMRLLRRLQVGRLVCGEPGRQLRPVSYLVVDDEIVLRADWVIGDGAEVVFEIDELDTVERQGWSVIVTGRSYPVDAEAIDASVREQLVPWAPGPKDSWMRITIDAITGRWVRAGRQQEQVDGRGYL